MLAFKIETGIILLAIAGLLASFITKSYSGIVRYTGIDDAIRIFYTSFLTVVISISVNLTYYYNAGLNLIPYSVIIISFFVSFLFLVYYRLLVKSVFSYVRNDLAKKNNVVIFGAGQIGMLAKQALDAEARGKSKVAAFFEDDYNKAGKAISGIPIYKSADLSVRIDQLDIAEVIIAVKHLTTERKDEIVELCISKKVKVRMVPSFDKWVKGEFQAGQIKEVNIEDLLGRDSIQLDNTNLLQAIKGRVICVTGASGSIGSELARQLIHYQPKQLVLVDQAESPLYELERELMNIKSPCRISFHLMDITNNERMRALFRDYKLEWVFHAAAYKHVPVMESNPAEAVSCNILGTKLLADLSVEFGVTKFVMISTDKAVNPTSIMGCSKRIAEIYVQSLNNHLQVLGGSHTMFVTTRFGNVLGSNGSVIPIFKKQIEAGGPITVTHPEVTRFFMTIPEACRLVLEAGTIGHGGEIFIFDMGKSVKIYDLAKKMVLLSGLDIGKDIDIVFTGLRDGEKLYEELLSSNEDTLPTHHPKILKARVREYEFTHVNSMIELLGDLITDANELKMVTLMKDLVPEYKSNYSKFEILDRH
ncbi:polysaccharide biosynthesis protein [Chryseotalea sanaruensis]|uniref:Polysaccharide biosynthesis protein n=1 Tax=Chryseotalea sanaruensis TaxID=2482724 RepID=A0A401U6J7_9BACT|nr:nucleoside-diphosphate sugar epimerase/dehydratase [Chryseotalea sanaruensis]GCC50584.1 polysaccharide biosynthesis protein [Chryseotalea sanaruensis]